MCQTSIGIDNLNDYYDVNLKYGRLEILEKEEDFTFYKIDLKDKEDIDQLFEKYNVEYGNFQIATSSGNPLSRGGVVNRPWATLYKGSDRKQYAAQITIGIDADAGCLDVGFYFGKASSHNIVGREKSGMKRYRKSSPRRL